MSPRQRDHCSRPPSGHRHPTSGNDWDHPNGWSTRMAAEQAPEQRRRHGYTHPRAVSTTATVSSHRRGWADRRGTALRPPEGIQTRRRGGQRVRLTAYHTSEPSAHAVTRNVLRTQNVADKRVIFECHVNTSIIHEKSAALFCLKLATSAFSLELQQNGKRLSMECLKSNCTM